MNFVKKLTASVAVISCLFAISACNRRSNPTIDVPDYSDPETTETETVSAPNFSSEWRYKYSLTYEYTKGKTVSVLSEYRDDGFFCAVDNESKVMTYYKQGDEGIDRYILNPSTKKGTHAVLKGRSLEKLVSGFMQLSLSDPSFISKENVIYSSEDVIAGRPAKKYIQMEYQDSVLTRIAYIWIDTEFGFASRCEVYDGTGGLAFGWKLTEFSREAPDAENLIPDISKYKLTELGVIDNGSESSAEETSAAD
ncbi:MAG: hypothetical protein GXY95_06870 [Clostridiales bacterium]|nr:hypothetical protein [Clostridiales bacterium]HOL80121.1 hypothetical protein [Clostridiales bacterium]HPP68314.1 hypothetical protein [Clostridiales bacterium]HPU67400.1 hypothetical protein [Clostridiales bacterium]HQA06401.1 hypothetical protein [Clostridiales bacterium]